MISFKKVYLSKALSLIVNSNQVVVSVRFCSFDGRCRASRLLQPLNLLPFDEDSTRESDINKFENVSAKSQRLLVDLGLLRPSSHGTFVYMSLALRSLEKLTALADVVMEEAGCQKIVLPSLTDSSLWKQSGRLESMQTELLTTKDRSGKNFVLGPTHEEAVTSLISGIPISYRNLPLQLYQITTKYRDEIRPKYGLIRSKEFLMKDLYTFDKDLDSAKETYERISEAYHQFFRALEVPYLVVEGSSGEMGGSISHEFQFPAEIGQDRLLTCPQCGLGKNLEVCNVPHLERCLECNGAIQLEECKSIEVGHTFLLGDKYSKALSANYMNKEGKLAILQMGCYGIGLSRILAASVEVLSTETKLRWPKAIVPITVCIISPKTGSKESLAINEADLQLYDSLISELNLVRDVIIDDRAGLTVGKKLREALQTGYRFIILFGKNITDIDGPKVEVHCTETGTVTLIHLSDLLSHLSNALES